MLVLSIIRGRKHPASAGVLTPRCDHYPHVEQIVYSTSRTEAPAPGREAVMRQRNAGIEEDCLGEGRCGRKKLGALPGFLCSNGIDLPDRAQWSGSRTC